MASLLKEQKAKAAKADAKGKGKRRADDMEVDHHENAPTAKKPRNKQRVLMLSSRGINHRMRHLMNDLEALLPHVKKDAKLDSKNHLHLLPELADLNNCNNTLYFEARRHEDLYLWAAKTPNGPSIKMHVQNIHTMDELKMTGNCLKGSRGILSFAKEFDETEWGRLTKELFTHIFGVPPQARKAKPFIDHILTFSILDNKIWFRNFQIVEKDPLQPNGPPQTSLVEIGPRFVLTPIRIFEGAFNGATVYSNPEFVTPTAVRSALRREKGEKYGHRKHAQAERNLRKDRRQLGEDELAVSKHAIQNPLSCKICAEHIQPGMSLEDHWRQSNKHPFCDRCERGFKDKRVFNAHTLLCALAVGELVPGSVGNPDLKGEILKSQARSGAGNEQADVQGEPNMRAAAIASECLTALSLHNADDGSHSTSRGSSPATTSEGSDTIRPDEPVLSLSLLLSEPLSECYDNKSTQLDTTRERVDTFLANARREPAWQQRCLEHPFPPLSRKPDCQLHEARRENTQDTATATQLWSDIVANRNRPSNADAAGRVRVRSFLQARQDERPMLGERQERRQQPALDEEESASLSGSSPSPRTTVY
ncbi:hypothetical protein ACG7TL_003212 [Trametes sanguinea]